MSAVRMTHTLLVGPSAPSGQPRETRHKQFRRVTGRPAKGRLAYTAMFFFSTQG